MSLTITINADIKKAMLAREKDKLEALRSIKSALLLEATKEGAGGEISAAAEAAIGLAIIVVFYRNKGSIRVEDIHGMKG